MKRNLALLAGALGAALGALLYRRRSAQRAAAPPSTGAEELRRKLAEARETAAEEADLPAAGMGGDTVVSADVRPEDARVTREEVEAVRQRVHEEGRAAAEEMRRAAEGEEAR